MVVKFALEGTPQVSTGTTPDTPPKKTIDVWHVVLTALLSMAAAWIMKANIDPPKPQPSPNNTVIVEPPAPQPKPVTPVVVPPVDPVIVPVPEPAPVVVPPRPVTPTPINPAPPISTGLTVVDAKGNPLGNQVDAGVMFVVTCSPGFTMTAFPSSKADADVVEISDVKLICSLKNGCTLRIYVAGSGRPQEVSIQCNHGPMPPPVVVPPNPNPTPQPAPITNSGPVSIGIIEDATNRPLPMASILSNHSLWDKYRAAGHKVRIWNAGSNPSTEPEGASDIAAMKVANITQPGIVVRNQAGAVLYIGKMPTIPADVASTLKPFTGVTF